MKAKMLHFYPSFTDRACEQMPYRLFLEYYKAIAIIQSEEALLGLSIASYPYIKKQSRTQLYKKLKQNSAMIKRESIIRDAKEVFANLARKLSGG